MKVFKAPLKRCHGGGGDKQLENEAKYACLVFFFCYTQGKAQDGHLEIAFCENTV